MQRAADSIERAHAGTEPGDCGAALLAGGKPGPQPDRGLGIDARSAIFVDRLGEGFDADAGRSILAEEVGRRVDCVRADRERELEVVH
jgi:hypothetical protein